MRIIKAHCNTCDGYRNHEVLHRHGDPDYDDESGIHFQNEYSTLKCCGCDSIKLLHKYFWSDFPLDDETCEPAEINNYFPPAIFRKHPRWLNQLSRELSAENDFVEKLLSEIYVALQNDLPSLATMGIRSLLEKIMISKTGDKKSFSANLNEFEKLGYVSRVQKKRIETILEAGHATIHRNFIPTTSDVITLVDLSENIIETVYLHEKKVNKLKKRVPAKSKKP